MQVVNFSDYGSRQALDRAFGTRWLYVGPEQRRYGLRGSRLDNPYLVSSYGRAEAIELYRAWLWEKIQSGDPMILAALNSLTDDTVLVCWCKPKICHADVIVKAWEWLQKGNE